MSRLIDYGPDLIEYFPVVVTTGEYGEEITEQDDPITFTVQLQRLSSEELEALNASSTGGPVRVAYRFSTRRALPTDSRAQVRAWGRLWEVIGEPTVQGRTERTRHTQVVIRALTDGE